LFSGTLPSSIGNWVNLGAFNIGIDKDFVNVTHRALNGTIPDSVGNWTKLETFAAFNHQLSGTLPSTIGLMTNMNGFNVAVSLACDFQISIFPSYTLLLA